MINAVRTEDCYRRIGADYQDVLRRLGTEERVRRFLIKFPEDTCYADLRRALTEGNGEEAFRAAHSLKGICMNLGFSSLYRSVNALTEELRSGQIRPEALSLSGQVQEDYDAVIQSIGIL